MDLLNHSNVETRLSELERLMKTASFTSSPENVNNHIHTTYSFSPYSPTKAIYKACESGLVTAGIMDHDSVSGCEEFIKAGEIASLPTTIGFETRVDFSDTSLNGRRINNPDQNSVAYVTVHAIPHRNIKKANAFLAPYREKRNIRNRKMTARLSEITGIELDFDRDIYPISNAREGGSITERHILYALSLKIVESGENVVSFLKDKLSINVPERLIPLLEDRENPHIAYDLLGVLKSELVKDFYIPATDECPKAKELIKFAADINAISAYAYLGDVGVSVTGDKKAQKFEDDYLPELFDVIKELGFNAVTYMPSRNTLEQCHRLKKFCKENGFMEISGEDINSPRQKFICDALKLPEFSNLIDSTWELIRHEKEN